MAIDLDMNSFYLIMAIDLDMDSFYLIIVIDLEMNSFYLIMAFDSDMNSLYLTLYCLLRTKVHEFDKISILKLEGIIKKFPMSVATMNR